MWPAGILLLTLLCSSPQSRTASEWTAAGWEALRAGHATEAAEDFRKRCSSMATTRSPCWEPG